MEDVLAGPARIAIGIVLCAAGTAKLRTGHDRFLRAVLGYDLIKGRSAAFFARALPWGEIALGGALAVGIPPGPVVAATIVLLVVVTAAVAQSLVRGRSNHCASMGFTWERVTSVQWPVVYRNWLIAVALVAIARRDGGRFAACRAMDHCAVGPTAMHFFTYSAGGLIVAWAVAVACLRGRMALARRPFIGACSACKSGCADYNNQLRQNWPPGSYPAQ